MNRRAYLATVAASLGTAGCVGAGDSAATTPDLPDKRTYSIDEFATVDSVQVATIAFETFESLDYNNPEEGTIEAWDPGSDKKIIITDYLVENLSNEDKPWPVWENFHLVTPDETIEPIVELPDGTTVEELDTDDEVTSVNWATSEGLEGNYKRGWSGVFEAPALPYEAYAIKWTRPDEPIFWY